MRERARSIVVFEAAVEVALRAGFDRRMAVLLSRWVMDRVCQDDWDLAVAIQLGIPG